MVPKARYAKQRTCSNFEKANRSLNTIETEIEDRWSRGKSKKKPKGETHDLICREVEALFITFDTSRVAPRFVCRAQLWF